MVFDLVSSLLRMPYVPPSFFVRFVLHQFLPLPVPNANYSNKIVIVTGGNGGIGLEAARHFARLGARVIIACRNTESGQQAKTDIERANYPGRVEVWPLDLCSFDSVKAFCAKANTALDRLDVLTLNAGIMATDLLISAEGGGYETTILTNVISTFLMAFLLMPLLKQTAQQQAEKAVVTVVASEAHFLTSFKERFQPSIFECFRNGDFDPYERYSTSKLLDLLLASELANRLDASSSTGNSKIIVNSVNPGLCRSSLFNEVPFIVSILVGFLSLIFARSSEQGSRALLAAAAGGRETHGKYMDAAKVAQPSSFVVSDEGKRTQKRAWEELVSILDGVKKGVGGNI
ncbi:putative Dehydrogenase/reductase [Triangularia verruculosa]|uniref:Dehydrogenase/reductase n=1 Tax=Triangularia verruculosa TaxID=2587418 RepID=A0AAN6XPR8_9PEZI|nr:putative Dehydrogenase/reductase [Triangularia verruculosa]